MENALRKTPLVGEILLDNSSLSTVIKIRNSLAMINIEMSDAQIVNSIINTLTSKASYISILPLSSKVKLSLPEVEKLEDLKNSEMRAIEYLVSESYKGIELNILISTLRKEVSSKGSLLVREETENIVNRLHDELEVVFFRRYRGKAFRAGYKKLIIKSALASLVYSRVW